jgi:uncharacterized protein with PIN domain
MLGSLAKWLRILGFDTLYDAGLDDNQLVRQARSQQRVLLTRDRELARRQGVRVLLVESDQLDEQLDQVMTALSLVPNRAFSRCPRCNHLLRPIDRQEARTRVPAYVANTHETFKYCAGCQRVYWRGSHWQQIQSALARFLPPQPDRLADRES